jgi:multisubunit Na+/H+ antiporter MnhF subunit
MQQPHFQVDIIQIRFAIKLYMHLCLPILTTCSSFCSRITVRGFYRSRHLLVHSKSIIFNDFIVPEQFSKKVFQRALRKPVAELLFIYTVRNVKLRGKRRFQHSFLIVFLGKNWNIFRLFIARCWIMKVLILDLCHVHLMLFLCTSRQICYSYNKRQRDALFLKFILVKSSICFRKIYCPS